MKTPKPRGLRGLSRLLGGKVRNLWRSLTSMGTALVLLFLLALGAVPGALLPQRSLNAAKVDEYLALHPTIGPWLNRLQGFDVFSSFWFTAVYVLLCVSLVGCLTPRTGELVRSLRTPPVAAPRNLGRLPKHAAARFTGEPQGVAAELAGRLRGWRRSIHTGGHGSTEVVEISAERGYLREIGNVVFHFALLGVLAAMAVGKLVGYEGNVIVIADGGPGFCSASPAAFDSFRAGRTVDGTSLRPLCIRVDDFTAEYLPSGLASSYTANIRYQTREDLAADPAVWRSYRLSVNHPLRVDGLRAYLQGHGYAPTFTVVFPDGQTRTSTVQWRPDNPLTLLSSGVVRFDPPAKMYPDPSERSAHQIAIQGLLAPTPQMDDNGLLSSSFPALNDPAVAIDVFRGNTGLDAGRPQSLFALDARMLHDGRLVKLQRADLRPGQEVRLDDGTVLRFDGVTPFINVQVSYDPAQWAVLLCVMTMMAGLLVSLVVRRRRVWLRISLEGGSDGTGNAPVGTGPGPGTVNVELGGLARTDNAGWGGEFERLTRRLFAGLDPAASPASPVSEEV